MSEAMNRMISRRRLAAKELLGGSCVECGSIEGLQFDHIDRRTKSFSIAANWGRKWTETVAELQKCQLLCQPCHDRKSRAVGDNGEVEHGQGLSGKKNCSCDPCRIRKREYMREYMRERRSERIQAVEEGVL